MVRGARVTAYLLMGAQDTLHAGIVRDDRELFHQIIVSNDYRIACKNLDNYNVLYIFPQAPHRISQVNTPSI